MAIWPIQTPRGDMAVRRRRMQVRRRTAVALGVLAGVVEPPSDVTTLTRRPRIRPRSSTVRPTLVSPPSVNREAAAPYPFRPHDHTHTVSTMLNTAATATVHSLESTARALSPPPCRLLHELHAGRVSVTEGGHLRPIRSYHLLGRHQFISYTVTLTPQFSTVRTDVRGFGIATKPAGNRVGIRTLFRHNPRGNYPVFASSKGPGLGRDGELCTGVAGVVSVAKYPLRTRRLKVERPANSYLGSPPRLSRLSPHSVTSRLA
jgi:hypothetical protein